MIKMGKDESKPSREAKVCFTGHVLRISGINFCQE